MLNLIYVAYARGAGFRKEEPRAGKMKLFRAKNIISSLRFHIGALKSIRSGQKAALSSRFFRAKVDKRAQNMILLKKTYTV